MPNAAKRPNKNSAERINEKRDPKEVASLVYRPVLDAPNEYFFKQFKKFPIYLL